jgi:WD40 repeat protein
MDNDSARLPPTSSPASGEVRPPRERPVIPDHEVVRWIGGGSYGEVWLARNVMGTWRAVKVVRRRSFDHDRPYEREYEGIRRFEPVSRTHESQVDILHVGRNDRDGYFYYVMELADDATAGAAPGPEFEVQRAALRLPGDSRPGSATLNLEPGSLNPAQYSPKTLRRELDRRGRLPVAECVEVGIALATALEHLHGHSLVHRDVKPSNIIFVNGTPKLADIGLVTDTEATMSYVGTQGFLPPEGPGTPQADLFALGRTLYEMSMGRDRKEYPALPLDFPMMPEREELLELNAVLAKCCEPNLRRRYRTASHLRADLELLRSGQSVKRVRRLERRWRVALGTGATIAVVALLGTGFTIIRERTQEAQRRRLLGEAQRIRLTAHLQGWSSNAWRLTHEAAQIRADAELRDHAAAALAGLDARLAVEFNDFGASSVAFDASGGRLLLGGTTNQSAKVWDFSSGSLRSSKLPGRGPVGFRPDGTAVQLAVAGPVALLVWDVANDREWRRFDLPAGCRLPTPARDVLMAMPPDASLAAAGVIDADGTERVAVWSGDTGALVRNLPVAARALTFSPDASLLAAADRGGQVHIWSVADGNLLRQFDEGRVTVQCLALHRYPLLKEETFAPTEGWVLVAGNNAGKASVRDLAKGSVKAFCSGMDHGVLALALSPDGTLLAAGAGGWTHLFNPATGQPLLTLKFSDFVRGIAFAPDGARLAVCTEDRWVAGGVGVWDLEPGRGIQNLRGPSAPVGLVSFSDDGKLLAALSHDWQVGIWSLDTGRLRWLLDVPRGLSADNAALAFSPDGARFFYCSGTSARLWDLPGGRLAGAWNLPTGIVDRARFLGPEHIRLFRVESEASPTLLAPPAAEVGKRRVCRLRDLTLPGDATLLVAITNFPARVMDAVAPADGRFLVVSGTSAAGPPAEHAIIAFDGETGAELWRWPGVPTPICGWLALDRTGRFLAVNFDAANEAQLVDTTSWTIRALSSRADALAPEARLYAGRSGRPVPRSGCAVFAQEGQSPLVTLGIDFQTRGYYPAFSPDGTRVAWANSEGHVLLSDLTEVRRLLASVQLAW